MTELLFDPPWYVPAAIAVLGIYLFLHGNRRQDAKRRAVGGVVLLAGVALFFVGRVMQTDREVAENRSRRLVDAVEKHDWPTLTSLLDPKSSVATENGNVYSNREMIVAGAQLATEQYGLKNIRILTMESRQDDTVVTVHIDVISDQGFTGQPFPTSWQFEWNEFADGWKLSRIVCVKIGNETGPNLARQFPQAR